MALWKKQRYSIFSKQAEIIIVPSLWPEPAGLTNLEALAVGAALITTDTGGAVEYSRGRAALIPVDKHTDYENYDYPEFQCRTCQKLYRINERHRQAQSITKHSMGRLSIHG